MFEAPWVIVMSGSRGWEEENHSVALLIQSRRLDPMFFFFLLQTVQWETLESLWTPFQILPLCAPPPPPVPRLLTS